MGELVYLLSTRAFFLLTKLIAPLNKRARLLVAGQKGLLKKIIDFSDPHGKQSIWFHVASLGEYEQGRPIMEAMKVAYPECRLVVTFFSPSGYENKKQDPLMDAVFYLPFESRKNAK